MLALSRGFDVIDRIRTNGPMRFQELTSRLPGVSNSTMSRLLQALIDVRALNKVGSEYHLGEFFLMPSHGLLELDSVTQRSVQDCLDHFRDEYGISVAIFVPVQTIVMKLMATANVEEGHSFSKVGSTRPLLPLHAFAKVFLAWRSSDIRINAYHTYMEMATKRDISFKAYSSTLDQVRESGFTLETGEFKRTIQRLAIPVFLRQDSVAPDLALGVGTHLDTPILDPEAMAQALRVLGTRLCTVLNSSD